MFGSLVAQAPAAMAAEPWDPTSTCGTAPREVNVVAHHDDDLLFLFPSVTTAIRSERCVQTMYLVASDYHVDSDREAYMLAREEGVRAAYAQAAGLPVTDWVERTTEIDGHVLTLWTLGDLISLIEFRLPDNGTETGEVAYGSMRRLYAEGATLKDYYGQNSFDRAGLTETMASLIAYFNASVVRTLDPSATEHHGTDYTDYHHDHAVVARLTAEAVAKTGKTIPVAFYRDYVNRYAADNLTVNERADKLSLFRTFAYHDEDICGPGVPRAECIAARDNFYNAWTYTEYRATAASMLPYVPATPTAAGHRVNPRFEHRRLVNTRSGRCLAVPGAMTDLDHTGGHAAKLGSCTGKTRYFTFVGGYLKLDGANECLAPSVGSGRLGMAVVLKPCRTSDSQRWRWSTTRRAFVHVVSKLAIGPKGGATASGTPLVLQRPVSGGLQRFTLVAGS
jgi:hypothetical protein